MNVFQSDMRHVVVSNEVPIEPKENSYFNVIDRIHNTNCSRAEEGNQLLADCGQKMQWSHMSTLFLGF